MQLRLMSGLWIGLMVLLLGIMACETTEEQTDQKDEDLIGTWYLKYEEVGDQRIGEPVKLVVNADGSGVRAAYNATEERIETSAFNWEFKGDSLLIYEEGRLLFSSRWERQDNLGRHTYQDQGREVTDVYVLGTDTIDTRYIGKWVLVNQTQDGAYVPALRTIYLAAQGMAQADHFEPYDRQEIKHEEMLWQISPGHVIIISKDDQGEPDLASLKVFAFVQTTSTAFTLVNYDEEGQLNQLAFVLDPGTCAPNLAGSYNLTAAKINGAVSPVYVSVQLNLYADGSGTWVQGGNTIAHNWSVNGDYLFMYLANLPHVTYPYQLTVTGNTLILTWKVFSDGSVNTYEYTFTRS